MSADILERAEPKATSTFEPPKPQSLGAKLWAGTWPKLLAVGIAVGIWQVVAWSGWKPDYLLPSLLAGELLVSVPGVVALGSDMSNARNLGQADLMIDLMIVILVIGMVVDVLFSSATKRIRSRRGLTGLDSVPS